MIRRVKALVCRARGHRDETKTYDTRGRRVAVTRCDRCGRIDYDALSVMPRNRAIRRRWARQIAREIAR